MSGPLNFWSRFYKGCRQRRAISSCVLPLSFSSTVFAIKILEDRGELNALHGATAMGILVMQDIIAVVFLTASAGKIPSVWALAQTISFIAGSPLNASVYDIYARFRDLFKRCEKPVRHPTNQPVKLDADLLIFGMGRIGSGAYDEAGRQ